MALLKVSKENGVKITPKLIKERLFYFSDAAEHFHLETKSYAEHKALDILYSGVNEFKDDILEKFEEKHAQWFFLILLISFYIVYILAFDYLNIYSKRCLKKPLLFVTRDKKLT